MAEIQPKSTSPNTVLLLGAAGLIAGGLYLSLKKAHKPGVKSPSDTITASVKFRHKGAGEKLWVGFGYVAGEEPGKIGGTSKITNFTYVTVDIETHEDFTNHTVIIAASVPDLPAGKYGLLVFLQEAGGRLREDGKEFIITKWYSEQITVEEG